MLDAIPVTLAMNNKTRPRTNARAVIHSSPEALFDCASCISGGRLRRHLAAGVRARPAHGNTLRHAADALAIPGALGADLGAFGAGVLVMRRIQQHEMRRRAANLGAGHHQTEMRGLDVLAA